MTLVSQHLCASILLSLLYVSNAQAVPFHVVALDETGADFPDVLIIVRSLDGGIESFRALTDESGAVPAHELSPGLYQIIATCPYGICRTFVQEFMVASKPIDLKLSLKVAATPGNPITVGPVEHRQVEVQDREGKPLASIQILVRDATSQNVRWYETDANGGARIELEPDGETTVVAIYNEELASRVLQPKVPNSEDTVVLIRF